jgi:hypothetical protein
LNFFHWITIIYLDISAENLSDLKRLTKQRVPVQNVFIFYRFFIKTSKITQIEELNALKSKEKLEK